jgi:hypothetical protein
MIQVPRCVAEHRGRPHFLSLSASLNPALLCRMLFRSSTGANLRSSGSRAMHKAMEQEVSVLSSSKHGLVYLTPNDWTLVADKASRVNFRKGDTVVHKGKKSNGVYLLVKGTARVQIPSQTASPEIGPGEICGEMSFLEDTPASASVIAHQDVEALHLDRPTLERLFELFPHLASRFYRSLAMNLSRRLREMIEPNPTR